MPKSSKGTASWHSGKWLMKPKSTCYQGSGCQLASPLSGPLLLRSGLVSPGSHLRQVVYAIDFLWPNTSRNNDFKAFRTVLIDEKLGGLCRTHPFVRLLIMAHPHRLISGQAEVEPGHRKMATFFQLAEPLMRDNEPARRRHGEDALRVVSLLPQACDPVPQNLGDVLLRCQMDKDRHLILDVASSRRRLQAGYSASCNCLICDSSDFEYSRSAWSSA